MDTLQWTRLMLRITGCSLELYTYRPLHRFLYTIYAIMGRMLLYSLLVLQTLDIVLIVENRDEFTENIAITSVAFSDLVKNIMLSTHRTNMLALIARLEEKYFVPVTKEEMEIRSRFDRLIESTAKTYTALLGFFAFWFLFATIVIGFDKRLLVCRMWLPYNYSSTNLYLLTSAYEILVVAYGVSVTIACESLYTGLLLHVCCQFDILEHRFRSLNTNPIYTANQCASHHHLIYKYAEAVNEEFWGIVSFQFCSSVLMGCVNIYQLASANSFRAFVENATFLMCVFLQIFYYCLYGDVVKAKSTEFPDKLFHSGWLSWNGSSKTVLLMVMRRSIKPIEFTSMHVVSLSLESFMSLLKTSYSAFNLMSTTR
ncbi:odorant receptor 46a-like [Megachile rotundata]|uniref:odorant receptor 46a-like n=1 Tax=Megachile rotundata TaxID=143995 RepID=UPI003FD26069